MAFVPAPSTTFTSKPYSTATQKPAPARLQTGVIRSQQYTFAATPYNPTVTVVPPQRLNGVLLPAPTLTQIIINTGAKSVGYAG